MTMLYKKHLRLVAGMLAIGSLLTMNSCQDHRLPPDPASLPDATIYALNDANQLLRLNVKSPNVILSNLVITGVNFQTGERMLSIDFRPATGQLYGVSNQSRLFVINPATAEARPMTAAAFAPAINGSVVGIDFNPTVDRIRLVTNTGQNLRLNPETGLVAATDGAINGVPGATISEVAYIRNTAGATITTLYDIDPATDRLYIQNPPNNGTLTDVGPLGLDITGAAGFDVSPTDNTQGLVAVRFNGASELQQINLLTGRLQKLGDLPGTIIGLAIPVNPVAYAVGNSSTLTIFNPINPTGFGLVFLTGLQPGETLHGIDFRPANGQLYVLGSSSRLYTITVVATGIWNAVPVGNAGAFTLSGTDFGFDFNPVADRIRVVSNTGQNLRLNPDDGTLTSADGNLNPGAPNVTGAAYTNNFAGAATTTLYTIDARPGGAFLLQQTPPNNGTSIPVGPLGVVVENGLGFDIGGATGTAYALLRTGGNSTKVYTINLANGAATAVGTFADNGPVRGFTVGLGF